jgi:hypothetical protein
MIMHKTQHMKPRAPLWMHQTCQGTFAKFVIPLKRIFAVLSTSTKTDIPD